MKTVMTKGPFVARVNAWAEANDASPVTERMLEDWNNEGVFQAAVAAGDGAGPPQWFYGPLHYRRALLICRLKRSGAIRYSAIRAALWLRGIDDPAGPPREDLIGEWYRLSKQLSAQISSDFDPGVDDSRGRKSATLIKQMGPLAPQLDVSSIKPSEDLLLDVYQAARFERAHQPLSPKMGELFQGLFGETASLDNCQLGDLTTLFSGFMISSDEGKNRGETLIRNASNAELFEARNLVRLFAYELENLIAALSSANALNVESARELILAFSAVSLAVRTDLRWRIAVFLNFLSLEKLALLDQENGC